MVDQTFDEGFVQALDRARRAATSANAMEPRAVSAVYDGASHLVVIRLKSGATFTFPPDIAQGLSGASAQDLANVEITPSGDALHWEALDADLSVPDLLMGVFGSKSWMRRLHQQWIQEQVS